MEIIIFLWIFLKGKYLTWQVRNTNNKSGYFLGNGVVFGIYAFAKYCILTILTLA